MKDVRVVAYSIIGLVCIALTFAIHWLFIIPAAVLSAIGWRRLMKN